MSVYRSKLGESNSKRSKQMNHIKLYTLLCVTKCIFQFLHTLRICNHQTSYTNVRAHFMITQKFLKNNTTVVTFRLPAYIHTRTYVHSIS